MHRGRKRSSADFTFCCIAIDHFKRTPEETAAKLLEVSSKARENGEAYALDQAMSAAAKVAVNPRSPSRQAAPGSGLTVPDWRRILGDN